MHHSGAVTPTAAPRTSPVLRRCSCGGKADGGGECADCREKRLQRKATSAQVPTAAPSIVHEVLRSPGRSLDAASRDLFEPRYGHDFGHVRVHTDTSAAASAAAVSAQAYTVGRHVVFAHGRYAPGTDRGDRLLAHELAHVVQQAGTDSVPAQLAVGAHDEPEERQAEAMTRLAAPPIGGGTWTRIHSLRLQRAPTGIELAESKPFGHGDLKDDALKKKWRTYLGASTLLRVTPAGDYKGHCVKEYLTEVANTCPARFAEKREGGFCTGNKCLDIGGQGSGGDAGTGKMVKDGKDTFIDFHRTRHPESLLEGTGKNECSVVCHQLYKYDRKDELGAFYIVRNFRAGSYTPTGEKKALHITKGEIQKVPAPSTAPTQAEFAKKEAPGLKTKGVLAEAPPAPKAPAPKKDQEK